jgi:hypothetical protein
VERMCQPEESHQRFEIIGAPHVGGEENDSVNLCAC